jgi:methyl-accepting chemotaxis protein
LIVFMVLFTLVFAVSFYWFYQYATSRAMDDLRQSLMSSARMAASMVSADENAQVFASGEEEDPQYTHIADQLRQVRDANPKVAAIYTMVRSPNPNVLIFVVSADEDPETRAHLRSTYDTSDAPEMLEAFNDPIADPEYGADEYGVWLSGYAPIRDKSGEGVAMVGVDMTAEDVVQVQSQIRDASLVVFVIAYVGVFIAVLLLSDTITRPLRSITGAAQSLEQGEPFEPEKLAHVERGSDEIGRLARVFSKMAIQVQAREQKLKQEVAQLKIELDQVKSARQVAEITETDYFRTLQQKAKEKREQRDRKGV